MGRYINEQQKGLVHLMLVSGERPEVIAKEVGVSVRQAYKYQKMYKITGHPFAVTKQKYNAALLLPWAEEVCIFVTHCTRDITNY